MKRIRELFAGIAVILVAGVAVDMTSAVDNRPIKVGLLHSLTGTMAISEKAVKEGAEMAIAEINDKGGLLGRKVIGIVADGKSDPEVFAQQADRLVRKDRVCTVFGCWTSSSRKSVVPIIESENSLLIYPVQFEGLEVSPNVVYTGAAPNQQIQPAVEWASENLGKRFYLVGSDYVFPRAAHAIIKDRLYSLGRVVVGESFVVKRADCTKIANDIIEATPDVILNCINGDLNASFFEALRKAGIGSDKIPTISFSISESELESMDVSMLEGDYCAWNYFQGVRSIENREFVKRFKNRYGEDRVTSDPIVQAYSSVHLWAQAVHNAGTDNTFEIIKAIKSQSFFSPAGICSIDSENHYTWKMTRLGRIRHDGQFDIIWSSGRTIPPVAYPIYRRRDEWDGFLSDLYKGWGNSWANPELEKSSEVSETK